MTHHSISIEGVNTKYGPHELHKAILKASYLYLDHGKPVEIQLPDRHIPVRDTIEVTGEIVLIGKSTIRLSSFGVFKVEGTLRLSNIILNKADRFFIPSAVVSGSLIGDSLTFSSATVLSLDKGTVDIKNSAFRNEHKGAKEANNFALTFHGAGTHKVENCKINGFAGGIRCESFNKEPTVCEISDTIIHASALGIYLCHADCSLVKSQCFVRTGDRIVALGDETKFELKECGKLEVKSDKEFAEKIKTFGGPDVIYTLAQRAFNLYRSGKPKELDQCYSLLTFISTWLERAPYMKESLDPAKLTKSVEMSIFLSTYKGEQGKSLIPVDIAFKAWGNVRDPMEFERAMKIIDKSYNNGHIDEEELYSFHGAIQEYRHNLLLLLNEEEQKTYLLSLVAYDPLRFWYVSQADVRHEKALKNLRYDIFFQIAAMSQTESDTVKKARYSWIFQWGCASLGKFFREETVPESLIHRIAWTDTLIDAREEETLMNWYNLVEFTALPIDRGVKFEANFRMQNLNKQDKKAYQGMISRLIEEPDHRSGMEEAVRNFSGVGPLPGYVRRMTENAGDVVDIMKALRAGYDVAQVEKEKKRRFCLAVLDNFHLKTSPTSRMKVPENSTENAKVGWDTCSICLTQKMYPWFSMSLKTSSPKHTFCLPCMKDSMSTGDRALWGVCPGKQKDKDAAFSLASRQEMELCGMSSDKIYSIIDVRVDQTLANIDGWVRCPICTLGGAKENKLSYYVCNLCGSTITKEGTEHDFAVKLNVLRGLDSNKVRRGEGVFRECFHCAAVYEKGNACSTITCGKCKKEFNMTWGNKNINHNYDDNGVGVQRYVPKTPGVLWNLGVFKGPNGAPLELGQELSEPEAAHVVKLAKKVLSDLEKS